MASAKKKAVSQIGGENLTLNGRQLYDFLNKLIDKNEKLQAKGKNPIAMEITGHSGLGKTSVVEQVAKGRGLNFIKLNLAQIEELGDLVGFPMKEIEVCKENNEGDCLWVVESTINEYLNLGYKCTGNARMGYAPPEWIKGKTNGGILLIDDYSRADLRYIQAIMEIIDRQEYISWKLPVGWTVVLTSNPDDGSYMVQQIDDAHRTRFISATMEFNVHSWAEWAEHYGIDGRCINFMLLNSDILDPQKKENIVNPRTIVKFFDLIHDVPDFGSVDGLSEIQTLGAATVGNSFTQVFSMFINNKLDKLPSPQHIMFSKDPKEIVKELKSVITQKDGTFRSDIAAALAVRIINFSILHAKDNKIDIGYIDRLSLLLSEHKIFTEDISFNAIKLIFNGNRVKFGQMLQHGIMNKVLLSQEVTEKEKKSLIEA